MFKIVNITDPHILPNGGSRFGINPADRLKSTISEILDRHPDADLMVLSGDLSADGSLESYEDLSSILKDVHFPTVCLMGNHDDRKSFREVFPDAPGGEDGFVHSVLDTPAGRLIFLDTLKEGQVGGTLCAARMGWLSDRIEERPDVALTIFMHHPPVEVGGVHFSGLCLDTGAAFLALLRPHAHRIRLLSFGHVHLDTSGSLPGGIPFSSSRGTSHHMRLALQDPAPEWVDLSPSCKVILLGEETVVIHTVDVSGAPAIGRTPANRRAIS